MKQWYIQDKVFGSEQAKLVQTLHNKNVPHEVITLDQAVPDENSIFRGTVQFVKDNNPSLITIDNYACHRYYNNSPSWLNGNFVMLTWEELSSYAPDLFEFFDCDKLFIRPNGGYKIFTGNYITKKNYDKDLKAIASLPDSSIDNYPDSPILVAKFQKIVCEYRVLMYKDQPITIDSYGLARSGHQREELVYNFCHDKFRYMEIRMPDDFFVVDVALDQNFHFKIVELNNLFTAGWYDCDFNAVIDKTMEKL